jgi:O-methyltransferase/aklanonic acid methyltransferase
MVGPGGSVVGIDLAEAMLARARKATEDLANVTIQRGDAAAPPFARGSFDAVLASLVVYLLRDPAAAARRWLCLLRPGGVVGFSWVLAEDPRFEAAYDAVDHYVPRGLPTWGETWRRWSSAEAAEAMLPDGFEKIQTKTEGVETRYQGLAHWWQSSWLQGPRLAWQHVPPSRRDDARQAAFNILMPLLRDDGTLTRVRTTCYTTAVAAVTPVSIARRLSAAGQRHQVTLRIAMAGGRLALRILHRPSPDGQCPYGAISCEHEMYRTVGGQTAR